MSNKSIKKQELEEATIFVVNKEPLPLWFQSKYHIENGRVIADGLTFCEVLVESNKKYAIHAEEVANFCHKALDVDGSTKLVLKYEYPYVQGRDNDGSVKYFLNESAAEANDFKFSLRLSLFANIKHPNFFGTEKVLKYHTHQDKIKNNDRAKKFVTNDDLYLVGLEVEKVDFERQQKGDAWELLSNTGWSKEEDGSLGSNGYELVSPILPLFNNDIINAACSPVKEWIDGKSNDSCGGHITISNRLKGGGELLESFRHFAPVLYSLYPHRIYNTYCKAKSWENYTKYPEKYSAFYLKDGNRTGGRVEIRLFSRVTNLTTLQWRLNLLQLLIKDGGNINQIAQKLACAESALYKHFAIHYSHAKICEKIADIDKYAKEFKTHKNGISPSAKLRINSTSGVTIFPVA